MTQVETVVIGGGSTGTSILYNLAKRGLTDSLLIERGAQVASGQTSRSTALVRTHYSNSLVAKMALLSYNFFTHFQTLVPGYSAGYVETGLLVGVDEPSLAALKESLHMFESLGIDSRMIEPAECKRLEPFLNTDNFSGIVYEPHMGYAEPSTTASAFASAAQALGARVLTGTRVGEIRKIPGGGFELETTAGPVDAKRVVVAAGVWAGPLLSRIGITVPIKPVRHPVAIYRRPDEYSGLRPAVFDFVRAAYYKPEGRYLFFVGSVEAELDASAQPVDPDNYDQDITFDEVERFSGIVSGAFPVMSKGGSYERGYTGVYDNTPDQQPIIDDFSDSGLPGLYCVVGLSGHGFKLCPEFGRIMASMVRDGEFKDYDISPLRLKRFEEGRLLKSRYNLSTIG